MLIGLAFTRSNSRKLGRNLAIIINAGSCGNRATDGMVRLESDVLRFNPDLVIISFGMNDAGAGKSGLEDFSQSIRELVNRVRDKNGCEVLLRTPNPVVVPHQTGLSKQQRPGHCWPEQHQHLYSQRMVALARELGCPVVDHYALWSQLPETIAAESPNHLWMRMSDAFHPNQLGHLIFYRELAPWFDLPRHFPWES